MDNKKKKIIEDLATSLTEVFEAQKVKLSNESFFLKNLSDKLKFTKKVEKFYV